MTSTATSYPSVIPVLSKPARSARRWRDYEWSTIGPFLLSHLAPLGAFWVAVPSNVWIWFLALYAIRMFGVTGGYHRYFAHRTYKTSRVFQFVLAFIAQSSAQRGVLWWAAHHRDHHKYSDTKRDVHSPVVEGFWYAHMGWLYHHNSETKLERVRDLAKYPELRFLNQYWLLPPIVMGAAVAAIAGWGVLLVGFMGSTVLCWHSTFFINSLAHVWGSRRYNTTDDSRNNFWLALLTMGEGWHNNHHHHMGCARQGFFWWEIDFSYYTIKGLEKLGLVWDVREPPAGVVHNTAAALREAA